MIIIIISSSQTWRSLSFIYVVLTILLLHTLPVKSQRILTNCFNNNGNYTSNSTYSNNLNTVLASLPSNMSTFGFGNASAGLQNPDRANVVAFCRADRQPGECRECIQNATNQLLNACPNQKQAFIWRESCTLRYSNESLYGVRADLPARTYWWTRDNVTSPDQFYRDLRVLLDDLRSQASSEGSLIKAAAGSRPGPDFQTIYALSQCSPDITAGQCTACLNTAAQRIPGCCAGANSVGVRILQPSCNIRHERFPFYNLTRIQEARAAAGLGAPAPTLPPAIPPPPGTNGDNNTTRNIIIIVVVITVFLVVPGSIGTFLLRKRRKQKPAKYTEFDDDMSIEESFQYDFGKLRAATNDFSEAATLGQGGFGVVYKGTLENGQEIAVKRLSKGSGQGDIEFKNEVLLMAKLQHRNLVRLLGFAIEGRERLLIYEFLQNSSLDHFIFDSVKRPSFDWDRRHKIIGGIARGLLYLHEDSRLRIIHRDLKAANILLDGEMNPKIADFGMARLVILDQNEGTTSRIVGTYGYMPPEYAMHGHFSVKSDVFSFGVLILEIISGEKNNNFHNGEDGMLSFAWRNWREGTTTNMIDPVLRSSSGSLHEMSRCIHIGLLCVQENIVDRPTMASVILMLNSFSMTMPLPSQPAFFVPSRSIDFQEHTLRELEFKSSSHRKSAESTQSKNEASISELYPR